MQKIGLIRHGTTEWNMSGRMQGQTDTPLAEVGRWQARLLAQRLLADKQWDGIVSSDLSRAKETADIVAAVTRIPFLGTDARLRERFFGQVEGTTLGERIERWGERWKELDLGMESEESLSERWSSFLEQAETQFSGQRILIISHGGFIVPVIQRVMGRMLDEHIHNTSLTIMAKAEASWQVEKLNCIRHLQGAEQEI